MATATPYSITMTKNDFDAIAFAMGRYQWAEALNSITSKEGINKLTEVQAWYLKDAVDQDLEGGHHSLPLCGESLESRIFSLIYSIV